MKFPISCCSLDRPKSSLDQLRSSAAQERGPPRAPSGEDSPALRLRVAQETSRTHLEGTGRTKPAGRRRDKRCCASVHQSQGRTSLLTSRVGFPPPSRGACHVQRKTPTNSEQLAEKNAETAPACCACTDPGAAGTPGVVRTPDHPARLLQLPKVGLVGKVPWSVPLVAVCCARYLA